MLDRPLKVGGPLISEGRSRSGRRMRELRVEEKNHDQSQQRIGEINLFQWLSS
jgi:hypothetical protein